MNVICQEKELVIYLEPFILKHFFDGYTFASSNYFGLIYNTKRTVSCNFVCCVFEGNVLACSAIFGLFFVYFGGIIIAAYPMYKSI
jgi:hypothetical protein